MLGAAERIRLVEELPHEFPVTITLQGDTRQTTIEPDFLWGSADSDEDNQDYPLVLLNWENRGAEVSEETELNDFTKREYVDNYSGGELPDDEVFKETREDRQEDELQVVPIVETEWVDDVPPQARGEAVARQLWRWFRFQSRSELNTPGANGERPMTLHLASTPTPTRTGDTYRLPFTVLCRHTESFEDVVPVVQDEEINADSEVQ